MEIIIYPYILSRRTEYSKMKVFDTLQQKDISASSELAEKIIDDYKIQKNNPNDFFIIEKNRLLKLKDAVKSEDIKYIFVPDGVRVIDNKAFYGEEVEYVNLPNSLEEISEYGFLSCEKLKCIDIPKSVEKIGFGAFKACYNLEKINLPNIRIIDQSTFSYCNSLKQITIPNSVEFIKENAFYSCPELQSVNLSINLKTINGSAFEDCTSLKNINLPNGLKIIGPYAFASCASLNSLIIPDTVTKILEQAFFMCQNLTTIKLPRELKKIDNLLFGSCEKLEDIYIPDSVETFGERIFDDASLIKNVNIPRDLKVVSPNQFTYSDVECLTFNYDLLEIKPYLADLIGPAKINKIVINNSVKTITPYAFGHMGYKIKEIEYHGSKEEFEIFKNNNKELFKAIRHVEKINIIEPQKDISVENISR